MQGAVHTAVPSSPDTPTHGDSSAAVELRANVAALSAQLAAMAAKVEALVAAHLQPAPQAAPPRIGVEPPRAQTGTATSGGGPPQEPSEEGAERDLRDIDKKDVAPPSKYKGEATM